MDSTQAARQVLARAAVMIGGVDELAARLEIDPHVLKLYIAGEQLIPDTLYLRAIDIVLEGLPPVRTDQKPQPHPPR